MRVMIMMKIRMMMISLFIPFLYSVQIAAGLKVENRQIVVAMYSTAHRVRPYSTVSRPFL